MPSSGLSAARMPKLPIRFIRPPTPITMNHSSITGPNQAATAAVPHLCTTNKPIRIAILSGMMNGSKAGVASFSPSTADSTDTAGVIMASP